MKKLVEVSICTSRTSAGIGKNNSPMPPLGWLLVTVLASGYAAAGGGILALVITRQGLEFAKRRDTPGIDLAYHLGGCVVGVGLAIVVRSV